MYSDCVIMEVWPPFHDVYNMHPQNITVRLKFSFMIICNCDSIIAVTASMTYITIMEFFDECPTPSSPEMIDHDTDIYINDNNINGGK